ncbi:DUF4278 domain-containing protein [Desmonostoc muscorum LEGE 12446]|uniref:DUF4278 domain-containing protein n=1 Tax=Desmonostoc muscorum TaxID=1179 RepID=UPI001F2C22EF|nr:DUF4278 domain-containing protein [Desmonostoc muscorum]MCF2150620.1 DUF4278 domain-containing protein [Desmonostoc muscorum LEGE 12446]
MASYFLIIPCACLIASYFALKKINSEISHLVAVFAVISLILGLIFAPWQMLLLLLIPVIISTTSEYSTSKGVSEKIEFPQQPVCESEADCNLIYRGVSYRADPNGKLDQVTTPGVTYKLSFRGSTYFICANSNIESTGVTTPGVTHKLSFRGSTYCVNKTAHKEIES